MGRLPCGIVTDYKVFSLNEVETYELLLSPELFGLNPDGTYITDDGIVYLFDERTRAILDIIGAVSILSN